MWNGRSSHGTTLQHYIVAIIAAFALVAWQFAWPHWGGIGAYEPDLALALVICVGMLRGPIAGSWIGVLCAVLLSSMQVAPGGTQSGGAPMGGIIVSLIATGYIAGALRTTLLADRPSVAMLITVVAVPLAHLIQFIFVVPPDSRAWLVATLIQAPYTAIAAGIIYLALRPLLRDAPQSLSVA